MRCVDSQCLKNILDLVPGDKKFKLLDCTLPVLLIQLGRFCTSVGFVLNCYVPLVSGLFDKL